MTHDRFLSWAAPIALWALLLLARRAAADPSGFCFDEGGGSMGTFCAIDLPVEMLSEDVSIVQDTESPWSWRVRADYRFRNPAPKSLTVPLFFPADAGSSTCHSRAESFRVRIDGKNVDTEVRPEDFVTCDDEYETCELPEKSPPLRHSSKEGCQPLGEDVRKCDSEERHCFMASFPASKITEMRVDYSYQAYPRYASYTFVSPDEAVHSPAGSHEGLPAIEMRTARQGVDLSEYGVPQSVKFVLRTGANWEGSIGEIKMAIAFRDIPYNLRFCYGDRCTDFPSSGPIDVGGLEASVSDDGSRTTVVVSGKNIEPDGDIELRYDREFIDLISLMETRCRLGPDVSPAEIDDVSDHDLRLCRYMPHHYLGYKMKGARTQAEVESLVTKQMIYELDVDDSSLEEPCTVKVLGKRAIGSVRARYRLPKAFPLDNKAVLARGMAQLDTARRYVKLIDEALAYRSERSKKAMEGAE